ncbi:hypothetical protein D915_002978 [Fasciola hepatica]|uniref:Uncharacterized protein n=1 Tax=Fasciola hepatica TaxID=6192 RepID=A0A4E0S183_FASHE|nr:hypothetical protein D915_002978 [Fasciola hepatica]
MSIVNRSPSTDTPVGLITGWRKKPLIDCARWTRAQPTNRIDALSTIWNDAELRGATVEQIERRMAEVLVVFRSHGNDSVETSSSRTVTKISGSRVSTIQRPARTHLLAYLIWLSAMATAAISRTPLNNLRDEHRQLIGVTAYPELFGECVPQLKSSSSIPIELRIRLCQLCSVLMHRIATGCILLLPK